jgi:tetratricopeptide (TPR) repeat protein
MSRKSRVEPALGRMRRLLPAFGFGVLVASAATAVAISELLPEDSPGWTTAVAAICGVVAAFVIEQALGSWTRALQDRRVAASAARALEKRSPLGSAALLSPRRGTPIVPFLGRAQGRAELLEWCTTTDGRYPRDVRYRLLTGPGGLGKTRLAVQLIADLEALTAKEPWDCLFIEQGKERAAVRVRRAHARDRPLLFVVDYAENRPELRELLTEALNDTGTIRILMLARTVESWWKDLTDTPGDLGALLVAGYDNQDLPENDAAPQLLLDSAAAAFATELGVQTPEVNLTGIRSRPRALDISAAALVAVLNQAEQDKPVQQVKAEAVFDELLRHESKHWERCANDLQIADTFTSVMRETAVVAAVLLGAATRDDAVDLATRAREVFPHERHPDTHAVAVWLRKTYPAATRESWAEPMQPDRLAEYLVRRFLSARDQPVHWRDESILHRRTALLERLNAAQATGAMTVLHRSATDSSRTDGRELTLQAIEHLVAHLPHDFDVLEPVHGAVPFLSTMLAPTRLRLALQLHYAAQEHDLDDGRRARVLHELALAYQGVGRPSDALPHALEAVAIFDELNASVSDRYTPILATSLTTLSIVLAHLGRPDEALPLTQVAIEIYEDLARDSDRYTQDLAGSLSNLGVWLADLGRPAEALPPTERALSLYQALPRADRERATPDLAAALSNLGNRLAAAGRPADALPPTQQAAALYEELVRTDRDRFAPEAARTLRNLAMRLTDAGRTPEALQPVRQAVNFYTELRLLNEGRFTHELAASLFVLTAVLVDLGHTVEALPPAQQAADIYNDLVREDPDRFTPDASRMAAQLSMFGVQLGDQGRWADALPAWRRAAVLYEVLMGVDRETFASELATSLSMLGATLSFLDRPRDAAEAIERSIPIFNAALENGVPDAHVDLLMRVEWLVELHGEVGDAERARHWAEAATKLRHDKS